MRYKAGDVLYKYSISHYGRLDHNGEYDPELGSDTKVVLTKFWIKEVDTFGYYVCLLGMGHLGYWISDRSLKRYAYPSRDKALKALIRSIEKKIETLKKKTDLHTSALLVAKEADITPYPVRELVCKLEVSHPSLDKGQVCYLTTDCITEKEIDYDLLVNGSNDVSNKKLAELIFVDDGYTIHSFSILKTKIISL